ncbi:MAG: phenylalanine--tRNA ligase subunit alpha [Spirochaetales bacterium]|nr:phenylalanine--tRNA ligase subunit alpha [Spirochaetales bacterium]MCF7939369.1 phenylalanine--tRNA ligase subunit alpha [Spirochaetales bacterium]
MNSTGVDVKSLHPLEVKVIRSFREGEDFSSEVLKDRLEFNQGQANQAVSWLEGKELISETSRSVRTVYELTELGEIYQREGTPLERIVQHVSEQGPDLLNQIAASLGLDNKDAGSAFGALSKEGLLAMDENKQVRFKDPSRMDLLQTIRALLDRAVEKGALEDAELSEEERKRIAMVSKKRGAGSTMFRIAEREESTYCLTDAGLAVRAELEKRGITGEEIGELTPEMLADGRWKGKHFRAYNINIPPARTLLGRSNPYADYLREVKDNLVSLGFQEFDGPLVETEFWNSDALFMPQFHAARDIHDVYYTAEPSHAKKIEQPYLDNVAAAHQDGWKTGSRGWGYKFDRDFTRRLILRSQGTVLSAKQLHKAEVPSKYFGIVRCFRYDQVDATHLSDFYQTEGIVLGEEVNLRTLLGLLEMFAVEVAGAKEVKYVPGYFPFTEPSVEVHIKHPVLGWFELGGSGIFRPEVTKPMGVDVPVLAWGLGIDRMALMTLGLDDLRELFSPDLEAIRLRRRS